MKRVTELLAENVVLVGLLCLVVGVPIIASPYTQTNVFLIKTVFFQSLVFGIFIFWLAGKFLKRESFGFVPLTAQWLSFLGVCLMTFAFSPYRYAAFEEFLRFLSFFLLYVLVVEEVRTERRKIVVVDVLTFVTLIACFYGILQGLGLHVFVWERADIGRIMSFFGNPNFFGTYLVAVIPVLLVLSMISGSRRRLLAVIALMSALVCLIFAGTRSAWVGFAVSLALFVLLARRTSPSPLRLRTRSPLLIILLVVLALVVLNQEAIVNRISELGDPQGSASFRVRIWEATLEMIEASPVLGSGLGTFQIVFPRFRYPGFAAEVPIGNLLHAHNEYLEIWAETGLLGLGTFLWLMVSFFGHVLKRLKTRKESGLVAAGLLCGVAGVLADSLFSASLRWTGPAFAFWLVVSLTVAAVRTGDTSPKEEHRKSRGKLAHIAVLSAGIIAAALIAGWHIQKYKANVHVGRAQALLDAGLPSKAAQELEKAQEKNPHCLPAIYLLGCLQINDGEFKAAKKSFERLDRLAPDYANGHEWKGYLYFRLEDLSRAEEEFRLCIRQKSSVFRHNMLGRIYSLQEKWDQALEQLEQSVRLGAGAGKSRVAQAAEFSPEEGMEPSAELTTDAGLRLSSAFEETELVNTHIMLARIYCQKREYGKSILQVERVAQASLNERQANAVAQICNEIAFSCAQRGVDLDRALALCEKALGLDSSNPERIHDTRAWVYFKKGQLKEARLEIQKALKIAPQDPVLRRHLDIIEQVLSGKLKDIDLEKIR